MFYALAIVCDDFFVPSLEKICEVRERVFLLFKTYAFTVGRLKGEKLHPCLTKWNLPYIISSFTSNMGLFVLTRNWGVCVCDSGLI